MQKEGNKGDKNITIQYGISYSKYLKSIQDRAVVYKERFGHYLRAIRSENFMYLCTESVKRGTKSQYAILRNLNLQLQVDSVYITLGFIYEYML